MANPNEWSHFFNTNQPFLTTPTTTSPITTATNSSTDALLSPETGRVTKPTRRRSRASRRTPTTLLNTDTSNFRDMVQQFTGGPSAMGFGSGNTTTSGFSLTSSLNQSVGGSSQQGSWQYNFQPHVLNQPLQGSYMFNVNPLVGYSNTNNPNTVVVPDRGGGGGSAPSAKGESNSNNSSRLQ